MICFRAILRANLEHNLIDGKPFVFDRVHARLLWLEESLFSLNARGRSTSSLGPRCLADDAELQCGVTGVESQLVLIYFADTPESRAA